MMSRAVIASSGGAEFLESNRLMKALGDIAALCGQDVSPLFRIVNDSEKFPAFSPNGASINCRTDLHSAVTRGCDLIGHA
jgi:hypothetical protein